MFSKVSYHQTKFQKVQFNHNWHIPCLDLSKKIYVHPKSLKKNTLVQLYLNIV